MSNILTYVRVVPATTDVQSILEILATVVKQCQQWDIQQAKQSTD